MFILETSVFAQSKKRKKKERKKEKGATSRDNCEIVKLVNVIRWRVTLIEISQSKKKITKCGFY